MSGGESLAAGTLYLVATPIGNLGDITLRALETLKNADFIACEDTRVTRKLLTHFDIRTPMVSYHEHNRRESGMAIVARLLSGECAALVTDAGMPVVSDPGENLVSLCREAGLPVCVVPGACAAVSALALSGLPGGRFCFEGFLSTSRKSRREHLAQLRPEPRTMIFYEAPHKLPATLRDLIETLGAERPVAIGRELTKLYEQSLVCTLGEALEYFTATPPRGEFTLVVQGAPPEEPAVYDALAMARQAMAEGMTVRDAARQTAEITGSNRRELYNALMAEKANPADESAGH